MPPESCQGYLSLKPFEPDLRQQRFDPVDELGLALGPVLLAERRHDLERQHHVLAQLEPRQQRRVLERHADPDRLGADLAPADEHVAARSRAAGPSPA